MNSLLVALTAILQSLKTRFNDNLDRNLYLTLCHDDLASGVILGPRNLASDDIDKIAQEIVKLASPFEPFSDEMISEYEVLQVDRIWKFGS